MRHLLILLCLAGIVPASSCTSKVGPAPAATVVYVVRHGEKAAEPSDPQLSPAGVLRAEALARTFEKASIQAIYSSRTRRTESTVAPLSSRLGIPISYGPAMGDDATAYAQQLAQEVLARHRGQTVLIVNHSNTIPTIVEKLSGQPVAPIDDFEYATLFIVTIPAEGPASIVRAQYGQPDGASASAAPQAASGPTTAAAGGRS